MICPICKNECGNNETCPNCDFCLANADFRNSEEYKFWWRKNIFPRIKEYKGRYWSYRGRLTLFVDELGLSERTVQKLIDGDVHCVEDLICMTWTEIAQKNIGRKGIEEIETALETLGLTLAEDTEK